MSSSKRSTPTTTPTPTRKPSMRPFARSKSSDLSSINSILQRQIQELQQQLAAKTQEAETANARAQQAKENEVKLKELAKRFWKDEFSGMKDFMKLMSDDEYIQEIEERVLMEYDDLFGETRMEKVQNDYGSKETGKGVMI